MMTYASVFVGVSLDGYIARPNGDFDFLPAGGGEPHGYEEFMASVDALLLGRKTFDTVLGLGEWAYGSKPVYVLTSRPLGPLPTGALVQRVCGNAAAVLSALKHDGVRQVYVDGGAVIQQFIRAGLIDQLVVTRVPVLIGQGISLFGAVPHDIRLRHVATRSFGSGLVQSEYRILNQSAREPEPLWDTATGSAHHLAAHRSSNS
jgi:dihydrofolate reductase